MLKQGLFPVKFGAALPLLQAHKMPADTCCQGIPQVFLFL